MMDTMHDPLDMHDLRDAVLEVEHSPCSSSTNTPDTPPFRGRIQLIVHDTYRYHEQYTIRMSYHATMLQLMMYFIQKHKMSMSDFVFYARGRLVKPDDTPQSVSIRRRVRHAAMTDTVKLGLIAGDEIYIETAYPPESSLMAILRNR